MQHQLTRRTLVGGLTAGAVTVTVGSAVRAQTPDPAEQLRQFLDAVYGNADDATIEQIVDDVIAEDWVPEDDRDEPGREALRERLLAGNEVFLVLWKNWTTTIDEVFASDNRAAARLTVSGTGHDDSRSSLSFVVIAHVENGKLVQVWTGTGSLKTSDDATPSA
jgi:hypothetical protein